MDNHKENTNSNAEVNHDYALSLIFQFLHESGYEKSLQSLEKETGKEYESTNLVRASELMNTLAEYQEYKDLLKDQGLNEDEEEINTQGEEKFPKKCTNELTNVHTSNILCLRFCPDEKKPVIATGSTDKTLKLTNYETNEVLHHFFGLVTGGIIALDFHPKLHHLLLIGSMDGSHQIINIDSKEVAQSFKVHQKYVVRVKWSPQGNVFVTASYDKSIGIFGQVEKQGEGGSENGNVFFELKKRIDFAHNVEAIEFTKDGEKLIVAVREDNNLTFIDLSTFSREKRNMNKNNDNHVSFSAMDVVLSPSGSHIAVSTDHDRLIVYSIAGNSLKLVRNFYGAKNDLYSQPRCCWDPSGKYIYSTSQDHLIYVWDVVTQKIVAKLHRHKALVRDIHRHPTQNLIATCSYDKSVLLWDH